MSKIVFVWDDGSSTVFPNVDEDTATRLYFDLPYGEYEEDEVYQTLEKLREVL